MKRTRILAVIPNPVDSTSLYRGMGPISRLLEDHENFEVFTTNDYNWSSIQMMCDVLFMQRPHTVNHVQLAKLAKRHNKPIILDFDDDLFTVPESNPAFSVYGKEQTKRNIIECMLMADTIWCSTKFLQEKISKKILSEKKSNVLLVPNALDMKCFGYSYLKRDEDVHNLVMWRGSRTHDSDILSHLQQIVELIASNPTYTFHFQGGMPWFLKKATEKLENITQGDFLDPFEYAKMITEARPSLWIVPLEDNEFNRSKSNIAWLESIMSGGVSVCPNWEEWQVKGAINYNSPADFLNKAQEFLKAKTDPREMNEQAWTYITANLTLQKINKIRAESILETAGRA